MKLSTLHALGCPSCRQAFNADVFAQSSQAIESAVLTCPTCKIAVPVVNGFPLFNEARPAGSKTGPEWLSNLHQRKFGDPESYARFVEEKRRRKSTDLYAAFQPFNESSRALYPFIPLLKSILRPGDIILDTWCRTGWSGELLAGLFPEQHVIAIWEGDSNVLGYKGFHYWLPSEQRARNLDIVFCHPDHTLPFGTDSIRVIHGLDSLHRYRHQQFIPETLRICREDGALIFPHIHLTNSEPDPWFDRGCMQYHGSEWREWLDELGRTTCRKGWVLSEPGLFDLRHPAPLRDDHDTQDYNGLIFIGDEALDGDALQPLRHPALGKSSRVTLNPLLDIRISQGTVSLDHHQLSGLAENMRARHPCYDRRIREVTGKRLSAVESRLLWHAQQHLTLGEIAHAMNRSLQELIPVAESLCRREILHSAPVSRSMAALQGFYGQTAHDARQLETFAELWAQSAARYESAPLMVWLRDGSEINFEDADFLVTGVRNALVDAGLVAGDRIAVSSAHHPFALLVCWAAWQQGIATVMLDDQISDEMLQQLLDRTCPRMLFSDKVHSGLSVDIPSVVFDDLDMPGLTGFKPFSDWLEGFLNMNEPEPSHNPALPAAILFTSGSTGMPKAVTLSHRALCRSGYNMAATYKWDAERILSLGGLNMMSGLRNPAIAALASGSTILVPSHMAANVPIAHWEDAAPFHPTVITTVPAWLNAIATESGRLQPIPSLTQVLVTGAPLRDSVWKDAQTKLGVSVSNYYGMTETGGICAATTPGEETSMGTLGSPRGALIHIKDEHGELVPTGTTGTLQVLSPQLMDGYLDEPDATADVTDDGFIKTGDLAHWDENGNLHLDGRCDDLVKLRNGERLNPSGLESILVGIPGVSDAAIALSPHDQRLVAFISGSSDADAIVDTLKGKVPRHHIPDAIVFIDSLPRNRNGKLLRSTLGKLLTNNEKHRSQQNRIEPTG